MISFLLNFNFQVLWFKALDRSLASISFLYGIYVQDWLYLVAGLAGLTASFLKVLTRLQGFTRDIYKTYRRVKSLDLSNSTSIRS